MARVATVSAEEARTYAVSRIRSVLSGPVPLVVSARSRTRASRPAAVATAAGVVDQGAEPLEATQGAIRLVPGRPPRPAGPPGCAGRAFQRGQIRWVTGKGLDDVGSSAPTGTP